MNLLLFDYNKAFLKVYDTFEEIIKTNIISENIRSKPNKQILIKVCSDFILNWQKQIKKCCDLQIFLYIINHNNKESKKLFEIYYYIRKTLFSYQTELYRNNPLDMLRYDFEEANRLFKQLFSADLCKQICQRFVTLIQKHQKTVYKGNKMKGSFIAEFVLHEYLEIVDKQSDLLKEVIIHNRLLVKEQNKFEFRKRFKIHDSIIDYSPQQTGKNQGNKKFVLDLSMLDHQKLGIPEGEAQYSINQPSQNCLKSGCEHQQQLEVLLQREASLVSENGELRQANYKIKNQLIESAGEIESMKKTFDEMKLLTASMLLTQQQNANPSQLKESALHSDKANNIAKQFDEVFLSVSQRIQTHVEARATQKKQYKKLTLNNTNFGQEQSDDMQLSTDRNEVEEKTKQTPINKLTVDNQQVSPLIPPAPSGIKSNLNGFIKLNIISSEESFVKIKQTESMVTENNQQKNKYSDSRIISRGVSGDQFLINEIQESAIENMQDTKTNQGASTHIDLNEISLQTDAAENNEDNLKAIQNKYSIQLNGMSIKPKIGKIEEVKQSPHFNNLAEDKNNQKMNKSVKEQPQVQQQKSSQSMSNQSSIEDIYIMQVENSVKAVKKEDSVQGKQESQIKQISLFQRGTKDNQNDLKGTKDAPATIVDQNKVYSEKTEKQQQSRNSLNMIDQHLNQINLDKDDDLQLLLSESNPTNLKKYTLRNSEYTSKEQNNNTNKEIPNLLKSISKDKPETNGSAQGSRNPREVNKSIQILEQSFPNQMNQSVNEDVSSIRSISQPQQNSKYSSKSSQQTNNLQEIQKQLQSNTSSSGGANSEERQKLYYGEDGQKMFNSSAAKSGGPNIRNYSPSFHSDFFHLQGATNSHESNNNEVQNRSKESSIHEIKAADQNVSQQKQNSVLKENKNNSYGEFQKENKSDLQQSQRVNIVNYEKQKSRDSQQLQQQDKNENNQTQTISNSSSQMSQLKSKGSMPGNLIDSVNLQNSQQFIKNENIKQTKSLIHQPLQQQQQQSQQKQQQEQQSSDFSSAGFAELQNQNKQQSITGVNNFNQSNRAVINSKRQSFTEGDIKQKDFGSISQQRGSVSYHKSGSNPFSQMNQSQISQNSANDILDQSSLEINRTAEAINNKRSTFDIPEEEEIADENSDSNHFNSGQQQEITPIKKNRDSYQQNNSMGQSTNNALSSSQQTLSDHLKKYSVAPNQRVSMSTSQQNQAGFNNNINNNSQMAFEMNSSQQSQQSERTPDNQFRKKEFQSSSQKTGTNLSHSPFRKSMYASYQQNPLSSSGLKMGNYQQSAQLLQYSATSNHSNRPNISRFEQEENVDADEENENNVSSYNPFASPPQKQFQQQYQPQQAQQQNNGRSSLQIQNYGDLNQSNVVNSRNSILTSQHNRSILTQKNEILPSALDTSQISENKSRNSQIIYTQQDSVNDFNNSRYIQRDGSSTANQKLQNVLQDIDSPMGNPHYRNNPPIVYSSSLNPHNKNEQSTFQGAMMKHNQISQQKWQQQNLDHGREEQNRVDDDQSELDDVDRQSDTWLRDSVIENEEFINGTEIKRDSKTKQTFGPFKMNMTNSLQQDAAYSNPKPIFYGVPIAFSQTELVRKV